MRCRKVDGTACGLQLEQAVGELTLGLRDTSTDLEAELLLTRSGAFSRSVLRYSGVLDPISGRIRHALVQFRH